MKALVYTEYGTPDVLRYEEVEKPTPKPGEVLVKVRAASINSWDWDLVRGRPYIIRAWGLTKPRYTITGADIAGTVESVGTKVTQFKPGDEVFGDLCQNGWGAFTENACAKENELAFKSPKMTFEEASTLPQAGVMALQSMRDQKKLKAGDKVLINGAGGGVGTMAIQIAKTYGAEVTAVDKGEKLGALQKIGADHVIDYQKQDFTKNGQLYDLIIDVVANRSIFEYKKCLAPRGVFSMVGGTGRAIIQAMTLGPLLSMFSNKKLGILAHQPNLDLSVLNELYETEKIKPAIDKTFPLSEGAAAMHYFGDNQFVGKVVIEM